MNTFWHSLKWFFCFFFCFFVFFFRFAPVLFRIRYISPTISYQDLLLLWDHWNYGENRQNFPLVYPYFKMKHEVHCVWDWFVSYMTVPWLLYISLSSFQTRYLNQNRHHRRQENYLTVATGDETKTLKFCKSISDTNSWLSKDGFFLVLHFFHPLHRWVFNSISFDGIANLLYLKRELDFQPLSSNIRRISEWNISNMFEKKIFYATRKTNWHILGKTVQFEKLGNALYHDRTGFHTVSFLFLKKASIQKENTTHCSW